MVRMRSPLVLAGVLAGVLLLPGCTGGDGKGDAADVPAGPCAQTREAPPEGSQEQRLQADLDGDGRKDEVVSWVREGQRVAQAWLATGENALPEPLFAGSLLAVSDADGNGRAEVFASTSPTTGAAFVLVGCRLSPVTLSGTERPWEYAVGTGAALVCRPAGVVEEAVTKGPETVRRAWTLLGVEVTGTDPVGTGPVTKGGISCA
jgi:hypothetical protein